MVGLSPLLLYFFENSMSQQKYPCHDRKASYDN
jgi:hypothetical protein